MVSHTTQPVARSETRAAESARVDESRAGHRVSSRSKSAERPAV